MCYNIPIKNKPFVISNTIPDASPNTKGLAYVIVKSVFMYRIVTYNLLNAIFIKTFFPAPTQVKLIDFQRVSPKETFSALVLLLVVTLAEIYFILFYLSHCFLKTNVLFSFSCLF